MNYVKYKAVRVAGEEIKVEKFELGTEVHESVARGGLFGRCSLNKYLKELGAGLWRPGGKKSISEKQNSVCNGTVLREQLACREHMKRRESRGRPPRNCRMPWGPQPEHPCILTQMLTHSHGSVFSGWVLLPVADSLLISSTGLFVYPSICPSHLPSASFSTPVSLQLHSLCGFPGADPF